MQKIGLELKYLLKRIAIAYVLICIAMFVWQRQLIYVPAVHVNSPESYGLNGFADITLKNIDGIHIQVWYHEARTNYPTIIHFHGNAGNLSHRAKFFSLLSEAGFGVLGLDYRGYGNSEGSPSEEGFYQDARATINYAIKTLSLPPGRIIIYGESIGTGVAVQMATEYKIAALVLQSPFTSMEAAATYHYSWLPVNILLKDRFDSLSKITNINVPILFFHGNEDIIVPIEQGKELFARANEPKQAFYFPGINHNDFNLEEITGKLLEFSKNYKLAN